MTLHKGRRRDRGRHQGRAGEGASSEVGELIRRSLTGRTESSCFGPFFQYVFGQLSEKAAVSARIHSRYPEGLSKRLGQNKKKNSPPVTAEKSAKRLSKIISETDNLLLRLISYKVCKENLEGNLLKKSLFRR